VESMTTNRMTKKTAAINALSVACALTFPACFESYNRLPAYPEFSCRDCVSGESA
jgi:hypothetical protein